MLVLSRKVNEKIVFPSIQTTVQILNAKAGSVRLGIDAPSDVDVFREEILSSDTLQQPQQRLSSSEPTHPWLRNLMHQFNNRLNASGIGLALLRRQLELQMTSQMKDTLDKIEIEFEALKQSLEQTETKITSGKVTEAIPRRALLVEDDVNECELLAGFLRLAGVEVSTAHDGADALDYLSKHDRPDVILLDMYLPKTDGPTTVRAIRQNPNHRDLTIFGVTGADPKDFNLPQGSAGVDYWFHKPLNPHYLLTEMSRITK